MVQGGQVHEEDSAETLEGQGQTRIEPSALASQKWDSDTLMVRSGQVYEEKSVEKAKSRRE
jgi:hypothetical protein